MLRIPLSQFRQRAIVSTLALVASGCGGDLTRAPVAYDNVVDTTVLYALQGTPVTSPSGFNIVGASTARIDLSQPFDIAFDFDSTGAPVLYSAGYLHRYAGIGLQAADRPFDSISEAPIKDYAVDSLLTLTADLTFLVRSRAVTDFCVYLNSVPRYGKFHVLALDLTERTVTLEHLINLNCGYRSLTPGTPES
jgi:hypothetical protein